ncbi:MAG TPA: extradiol dioxygenase [Terriglobales bacterium]|nr:extradiol dioxygenase [Terriglobales bacterium]
MISGAHFLLYSTDADADRQFIRDVLCFKNIDLGGNWLLFSLPPSEMAVHPGDGSFVQSHADHSMLGIVLYLICDDLADTMRTLQQKGVTCSAVQQADWGSSTSIRLPSGGAIGLYEPRHPTMLGK